jgi:oligosaccharide reducing-end xylanase
MLAVACGSTVDVIGYGEITAPRALLPIVCKSGYPNAYGEVLKKTELQIADRLKNAVDTLFFGTLGTQRILIASPADGTARIVDTYHNDEVRTEGMGLGMLTAVMLDHRAEFDQLWRYASAQLEIKTGAASGFFLSHCNVSETEQRSCVDPYGFQQFITALIIANEKWGKSSTSPDYAADALRLLTTSRSKLQMNGGVIDGVTNTFDSVEHLPYDEPTNWGQRFLGTSLAIPGYYDLWAQVTGDSFYTDAAIASRAFLARASHRVTGLYPVAANFDGSPRAGRDTFLPEAIRVHLNLAIDRQWSTSDPTAGSWQQPGVDKMLRFFSAKGLADYESGYSLDGSVVSKTTHDVELVMANGVLASISNVPNREAFILAAWNLKPPEGEARYYAGIIYLIGNLILSGKFSTCP